jgi:formylglycine-generating enzyme required for sulfatase activity/chromosome segregation ATPase/CRP-like cAMP-binding protein
MHVDEVAAKAVIEEVRAGRYIFKQGDRDNQSIYVLDGEVSIIGDGNEVLGGIVGGSDNARHPIGHQQPRQVTARAKTNVMVAYIDSSLLDVLLTWDESSGYEVSEIESDDEDDWMTRMLQSPAFMQLPPANIQQLLMKMESVAAKAGEVIVRQGDEGDYFYVITNGRCVVTRKATAQGKEVKLAELGDGASFGEDALVSSNKRNASITMLSDGTLMRLAKQDFQELLQAPLVHHVGYEQAASLVEEGAIWLDVRLPGEFENGALPGARNIPLSGLRDPSTRLEEDGRFILCCDTGRRSASGAFVLSQRGLDVYVLEGGMQAVPATALVRADGSPAHALPGNNSAAVIALESPAETRSMAAAAASDSDAQLQELKARYDREVERIKEFQETARQTIQSAQQARKAAEEQVMSLQAQLQEARHAVAQAQLRDGADDARVQVVEQQLEQATLAQEQLRGELRDAQETQTEAETRLKRYEQQLAEAREASHRELGEARVELDASRQQISELEQAQDAHQARLRQLQAQLEAAQGDSAARLEQLHGELESLRAEHGKAQEALQAAEQARVAWAAGQQAIQQERADLQARLEAAQEQARSEQGDARQRITSLEQELQQLRNSHEELGTRASQLAAERDATQQQLGTLQQGQGELQQRLDEVTSVAGQELDSLRGERDAAKAELERLGARVVELEQSLQGGGQELAGLQTQVASYQEQLRAQQDAVARATEQAAAREAELQTALQEAQGHLDALQTDLAGRDERLQALEASLQERGALQDGQQQQLEALQAQLGERETEVNRLQQEAEALRSRESGLQAEFATLRREGEAALAEAQEQVQSAHQALGEEKETLQQDLERLRTELVASRKALEERQTELQGLEQARTQAEAALAAALAERADLESGLRAEMGSLETTLQETRHTADEAAARHAQQLAEREQQLGQQLEALQAELAQRSAGVAELDADQQRLQAELDTARQGRQALEQELAALREQTTARQAQQEEQLGARQQEITRLESELASLRGGAVDLDAERQRLQQDLEAATAELASVRGEAAGLQEQLASVQAAQREQEQSQAQQLEAAHQELTALRAAEAAAREQVGSATIELGPLRQTLAEQEVLVARIRAELVETTEENTQERKRLQAQLEEARKGLESATVELTQLRAQQAAVAATSKLAVSPALEARIAALEEQLEKAHSEAEELRTREMVMREEIDKVRAEAEVAQGLVELQGGAAGARSGGAQERELAEARQNVQLAVRLRNEAEEGRQRAQQELQRLQGLLAARASDADGSLPVVIVPSLDEPAAEAVAEVVEEAAPAAAPATPVLAPAVSGAAAGKGGLWLGALLGLVLGLAGAAGGFFLLQSATDPDPAGAATSRVEEPAVTESAAAAPPVLSAAAPVIVEPPVAAVRRESAPVVAAAPQPAQDPVVRRFSDSLADGGRGPMMVELRAAEFHMGSGSGSPYFDERPRHVVQLRSFAISRHEVSFAEYDRFAEASGRALPEDMGWGQDAQPVINVSWDDARAYAEWLSGQTGQRYRLPTEAEWEYAARAGREERYWWGNEVGSGQANCHGCGSRWDSLRTAPVGSFAANPFGLHDMNGNVQEWVQDCYRDSYQGASGDGRAVEVTGCARRVVRGGGYASAPDSLRGAARNQLAPDSRLDHVGFRLVRSRS